MKSSIKLGKMKSQVNGAVTKKCEKNEFHFVSMAIFVETFV